MKLYQKKISFLLGKNYNILIFYIININSYKFMHLKIRNEYGKLGNFKYKTNESNKKFEIEMI